MEKRSSTGDVVGTHDTTTDVQKNGNDVPSLAGEDVQVINTRSRRVSRRPKRLIHEL